MSNIHTESIIKDILTLLGVSFESVQQIEDGVLHRVRFVVKTNESSLLIGTDGDNLNALNYIVRRIVSKKVGEDNFKFIIDVNDYKEKNIENIKVKAKIMSDRARSFKVDVELDPMSSYERMLVHSFLEGESDITTESVGEGHSRRIVIRYTPKV